MSERIMSAAIQNGRLMGKVAIVTGAASGIGRGIAFAFAQEGAKVVITTNSNIAGLEETRNLAPHAIEARGADSAVAADNEAVVAYTERRFGRIDILVNNAGIQTEATLVEPTGE